MLLGFVLSLDTRVAGCKKSWPHIVRRPDTSRHGSCKHRTLAGSVCVLVRCRVVDLWTRLRPKVVECDRVDGRCLVEGPRTANLKSRFRPCMQEEHNSPGLEHSLMIKISKQSSMMPTVLPIEFRISVLTSLQGDSRDLIKAAIPFLGSTIGIPVMTTCDGLTMVVYWFTILKSICNRSVVSSCCAG